MAVGMVKKCFSGVNHTDMMNKAEVDVVSNVYRHFIESESDTDWNELDEKIWMLDFLSDAQMILEAKAQYEKHSPKGLRCKLDHQIEYCMAPLVLEAVEAILKLSDETGMLHEKNRYILSFYIAMGATGLIYSNQ